MTITAQVGTPYEAILTGAPLGLIGELGFKLVKASDASVVTPHRTAGITEPSPGTYYTTDMTPDDPGNYLVVWDHTGTEATEQLIAQYDPVIGSTYATVEDLKNYSPLVAGYSDDDLDKTLREAERWIDSYVWPAAVLESGLKYDPLVLNHDDAVQLNYATCAQAEYILHMGPGFFISGSTRISGGDYQESGAPKVAPKAKQHLLNGHFISLTGKGR